MPRQKKFEGPLAKISAEIPRPLYDAAQAFASKRSETLAQQIVAGLKLWLPTVSAKHPTGASGENKLENIDRSGRIYSKGDNEASIAPCIEALREILSSESEIATVAKDAIVSNLLAFSILIRQTRGESKGAINEFVSDFQRSYQRFSRHAEGARGDGEAPQRSPRPAPDRGKPAREGPAQRRKN